MKEIKKEKEKCYIKIIFILISTVILILELFLLLYIYNSTSNSIAKPIIYLYPEEETEVVVKLGNEENLTCTYPKYTSEGWKVIAKPNGELIDLKTGRNLYSLYWEGKNIKKYNGKLEEGFVVKGEDTIEFLEDKLEILGLSQTEAQEFIIYWLPQMEKNKYNYIRFQTKEEIEENMPLEITPKPDTIIRVMMEWKKLDKYIEVKEQKLETPERKGFVAVEWGGTKINN
ncbi:MAG: hypothetical protein ACI4UE_02010 [Candidatus Scatovivens sp.]